MDGVSHALMPDPKAPDSFASPLRLVFVVINAPLSALWIAVQSSIPATIYAQVTEGGDPQALDRSHAFGTAVAYPAPVPDGADPDRPRSRPRPPNRPRPTRSNAEGACDGAGIFNREPARGMVPSTRPRGCCDSSSARGGRCFSHGRRRIAGLGRHARRRGLHRRSVARRLGSPRASRRRTGGHLRSRVMPGLQSALAGRLQLAGWVVSLIAPPSSARRPLPIGRRRQARGGDLSVAACSWEAPRAKS